MGDYQQLNHRSSQNGVMNGFVNHIEITAEDVPVLKAEECTHSSELPPMSPVRKFLFISSLVLCGLTVVIFLWVLPCDCGICRASSNRGSSIRSWEILLEEIELKGSINVVPGISSKGKNLLFMLRGDSVNPKYSRKDGKYSSSKGGVIAIFGSDGIVAWWKKIFSVPRDMNCSLMDVNNDGINDCIIAGSKGLLAAMDPTSSSIHWFLHNHNSNVTFQCTEDILFPLILPDLDGDGVFELLTACSMKNWMFVVSGRGGNVLGHAMTFEDCVFIWNLSMASDMKISYVCHMEDENDEFRNLTLQDILKDVLNKSFGNYILLKRFPSVQHHTFKREPVRNENTGSFSFTVGERLLTLENKGRCPFDCTVTINVTDKRKGHDNVLLYNYTAENTYAMVPATLLFTNRFGSSEPVGGFVIKLWQWISQSHYDESDNSTWVSDNTIFCTHFKSHRFVKKRIPLQNVLKTVEFGNVTSKLYTRVHLLSERVILITFNLTDVHIINASQSDIIQVCIYEGDKEIDCQPNLSYQDQSLFVCDLDDDGSQELVSYLTTYIVECDNNDQQRYKLQSRVRVIRLEAEVPKLYEAMTKIS